MTEFSPSIWACLALVGFAGAFGVLFAAAAFMRNHCAVTDLQRRTRELRSEYAKRIGPGEGAPAETIEVAPAEMKRAA